MLGKLVCFFIEVKLCTLDFRDKRDFFRIAIEIDCIKFELLIQAPFDPYFVVSSMVWSDEFFADGLKF